MDFAKIRPRGGTKAQWEKANPVLAKREIGVQWETTIGVGEVVIKIGDGVNNWINLPEAVKSDITKKIIATLAVVSDDDPDLADGDSLDTLFGKIAKKFKYLKDNKLDKSARYDGTDSTSTELVPTANALRGVNAKADKNASDITTLNNNLSNKADKTSLSSYALKSDLTPDFTEVGSGYGLAAYHAAIGRLHILRLSGNVTSSFSNFDIALPDSCNGYFIAEHGKTGNISYIIEINNKHLIITSDTSIAAGTYFVHWLIYYG